MPGATTRARRAIIGNDQDLEAEASTRYGDPGIRIGKPRQVPGTVSSEPIPLRRARRTSVSVSTVKPPGQEIAGL